MYRDHDSPWNIIITEEILLPDCECILVSVFSFIYSKRIGTPAATMEDCLTDEEKHKNFDRLLEVQNQISKEKNDEYLGKIEKVLVEGESKTNPEFLSGRTDGGKIVNFKGDASLVGEIIDVKITKTQTWSLSGEMEK